MTEHCPKVLLLNNPNLFTLNCHLLISSDAVKLFSFISCPIKDISKYRLFRTFRKSRCTENRVLCSWTSSHETNYSEGQWFAPRTLHCYWSIAHTAQNLGSVRLHLRCVRQFSHLFMKLVYKTTYALICHISAQKNRTSLIT